MNDPKQPDYFKRKSQRYGRMLAMTIDLIDQTKSNESCKCCEAIRNSFVELLESERKLLRVLMLEETIRINKEGHNV